MILAECLIRQCLAANERISQAPLGRSVAAVNLNLVSEPSDDYEPTEADRTWWSRKPPANLAAGFASMQHRIMQLEAAKTILRAVADNVDADEAIPGSLQAWTMHEESADYLAA